MVVVRMLEIGRGRMPEVGSLAVDRLHRNGVFDDMQIVKLRAQVDAKRFIYAQPSGTPNSRGQRYWNATDGCCAPADSDVDDVAFLRAVIEDVKTQHPVDPARVFLVGFSNGGFMALRMACDASEVVTAVVNIAGSTWADPARCGPGRPVSILHLHGTADATIHFEGSSAPAKSPSPVGRYAGAKETNARFAAPVGWGASLGYDTNTDPVLGGAVQARSGWFWDLLPAP
jgi:polyhydroxybutyrate depolymerase